MFFSLKIEKIESEISTFAKIYFLIAKVHN